MVPKHRKYLGCCGFVVRAFGFCGFGIWDSVGFGFRVFGDLGVGGSELVNGLGNYGIGE